MKEISPDTDGFRQRGSRDRPLWKRRGSWSLGLFRHPPASAQRPAKSARPRHRHRTVENTRRSNAPSATQLIDVTAHNVFLESRKQQLSVVLLSGTSTDKSTAELRYDTRGAFFGTVLTESLSENKQRLLDIMRRAHQITFIKSQSCRKSVGDITACVRIISCFAAQYNCCVHLVSGSGVSTVAANMRLARKNRTTFMVFVGSAAGCLEPQLTSPVYPWDVQTVLFRRCCIRFC